MNNAMGAMNLYREELKAMARSLDQEGLSQGAIAKELGWSETRVTRYSSIKSLLHPRAWSYARTELPKNVDLATDHEELVGNRELPIGNWRESHFRALLRYLPCTNSDRGAMRAQMAVIQDALKRWEASKVTARWIEEAAMRYAWHLKLKRFATEHLAPEVVMGDRRVLFKNINNYVFGREESPRTQEKGISRYRPSRLYLERKYSGIFRISLPLYTLK